MRPNKALQTDDRRAAVVIGLKLNLAPLAAERQTVRPRPVMNRHFALWLLLAPLPLPSLAQDTLARPVAALHLGFGGNYGWLGVGGEAYVQRGRLSVLAGLGVAPQGPTVAGAAGVRYYLVLGATPHRLFGDLSVSLMGLSRPTLVPRAPLRRPLRRDYGPGVSIGYSYLARSGFTLTAGGGVGTRDLGSDFDLVPVVHIGAGWTWRR